MQGKSDQPLVLKQRNESFYNQLQGNQSSKNLKTKDNLKKDSNKRDENNEQAKESQQTDQLALAPFQSPFYSNPLGGNQFLNQNPGMFPPNPYSIGQNQQMFSPALPMMYGNYMPSPGQNPPFFDKQNSLIPQSQFPYQMHPFMQNQQQQFEKQNSKGQINEKAKKKKSNLSKEGFQQKRQTAQSNALKCKAKEQSQTKFKQQDQQTEKNDARHKTKSDSQENADSDNNNDSSQDNEDSQNDEFNLNMGYNLFPRFQPENGNEQGYTPGPPPHPYMFGDMSPYIPSPYINQNMPPPPFNNNFSPMPHPPIGGGPMPTNPEMMQDMNQYGMAPPYMTPNYTLKTPLPPRKEGEAPSFVYYKQARRILIMRQKKQMKQRLGYSCEPNIYFTKLRQKYKSRQKVAKNRERENNGRFKQKPKSDNSQKKSQSKVEEQDDKS